MNEQTTGLGGEYNQCNVMEYSGKRSCNSEGLPAPAMAAIFSTVSGGCGWFPTTSGVVGIAETNSKQQGDHPQCSTYNNPF